MKNTVSKWIILIVVIAAITVLVFKAWQDKQQKDKAFSDNCINKVTYHIPNLEIVNPGTAHNKDIPTTVVLRNQKLLKNILQLKKVQTNGTIAYQLIAVQPGTTILKTDTIIITINHRKYLIYGFESNAFHIDHQILECDELYQLNGKTYRSSDYNHIDGFRTYTGLKLHPLSPFNYSFQDPVLKGPSAMDRADFFYVDTATAGPRELFDAVLENERLTIGSYHAYSVYVYRKTSKLNSKYKGSFQNIKGFYDNDLLCYSRWMNGKLDIFYIIKDGNVIYDMIEHKEVSPPFEFD